MARFRGSPALAQGLVRPSERQHTLFERLNDLARRVVADDPAQPARAVFHVVLALVGLGFLMQVSHAATTVPHEAFGGAVVRLAQFRMLGLLVLLLAFRIGPRGVERFVPLLMVVVVAMLLAVYLPVVNAQVNGSRRWIHLPFVHFTLQPSELARVIAVLWVARRCIQLGPQVEDARAGVLPTLGFSLSLFVLILLEPDVGGAMLFLICILSTMWVGGARLAHVTGSMAVVAASTLLFGATAFAYVRDRLEIWLGHAHNDQVARASAALASGDLFGVGLTHGGFRNQNLQYMQTDYAFSLVGEELGLVGQAVVIGLLFAFVFFSLRLVSSLSDRYSALVAFGLLVSVAFQAMLHVQVVTGLAPPKGMNLPFVSQGGSSLVASCFAVGLALGAARPRSGCRLPNC